MNRLWLTLQSLTTAQLFGRTANGWLFRRPTRPFSSRAYLLDDVQKTKIETALAHGYLAVFACLLVAIVFLALSPFVAFSSFSMLPAGGPLSVFLVICLLIGAVQRLYEFVVERRFLRDVPSMAGSTSLFSERLRFLSGTMPLGYLLTLLAAQVAILVVGFLLFPLARKWNIALIGFLLLFGLGAIAVLGLIRTKRKTTHSPADLT
jgi:hypothetical protein